MDITVWEFPEELEPYRKYIAMKELYKIEDLMNDYYNDINLYTENPHKFNVASAVASQIYLLKTLHRKKMLRDLSVWKCRTPHPESGEFCGGATEHPDSWGCGYEKIDS